MEKHQVAIVIPAFNEESTIFDVVQSVKKYGQVIVVNDASSDNTKQKAEDAGAILVNHIKNKGYDMALNSGFIKAEELNCDAIITFDADGQHSVKSLIEYIEKLENGFDLILGVRLKQSRASEWLFKIYTSYRFNIVDPLCGMKGYSMNLYKDLGYFDSCGSIGTELAIFSVLKKYNYDQIEITVSNRKDSSRFGNILSSNYNILKALFKIIKIYG
jgi:glycosyltransferase involved in cell wall biosynthesis